MNGGMAPVRAPRALDPLPSFAAQESGAVDFYASREWYACLAEAATYGACEPLLLTLDRETAPRACLPLLMPPRALRQLFARTALSWTAPYTTWYGPALAGVADEHERAARALGRALGEQVSIDFIRLDCLDGESVVPAGLAGGLADAGYAVALYDHFENWYERLADGFDVYWQARPSQLRNTVRRKHNRLRREGDLAFELLSDPQEAERALAAYGEVYADSWKEPEPHPGFIPALIRRGMAVGAVHVGLLSLGGEAIAAQIWIVNGRRATIFKLAYRERARTLSPGSVLTWWILKTLCERIGLEEVDFGRGGDAYKRDWLPRMRLRKGLIACRTRSPAALTLAVRHVWLPGLVRRLRGPGA